MQLADCVRRRRIPQILPISSAWLAKRKPEALIPPMMLPPRARASLATGATWLLPLRSSSNEGWAGNPDTTSARTISDMRTLLVLMIAAMPLVLDGSSSAPASPSSSAFSTTKETEQTFSHEHRDCDLVGTEVRKLCAGVRVWQLRHSSS